MMLRVSSWYWFATVLFVHLFTNLSVCGIVQDQTVQVTQFTTLISDNGYMCATSSPDVTVSARTALTCTVGCQYLKSSCCVGVNYRQQSNTCEMFFNDPLSFADITGCQYFQISRESQNGGANQPNSVLIQQHYSGSNFFNRTWQEFKIGFGDVTGDYWIGNEKLHSLTKNGGYRLRIDIQLQSDQSWQWAEYNTFIVDDESMQYTLHIGDFNGTAYDGMTTTVVYFNLDGMKFSTFDSDNDPIDLNCALMYEAGFWYNNCGWVYVNSYGSSFQWQYYTLQTSRMTLISRY